MYIPSPPSPATEYSQALSYTHWRHPPSIILRYCESNRMGTEVEAAPTVLVPVVTVVVQVGRLVMSTLTLREREEPPALFPLPVPFPREVALVEAASEGSSTGAGTTMVIWLFSSALACISNSLRSSRSLWAAFRAASWQSRSLRG